MKIAHLTSVHPRYDTRIFLKQCRSLAAAGHDVTLIVADGMGDETRKGVRILDVGKPSDRLSRALATTRRVLAQAIAADCDLYHFHDPELMLAGRTLKRRGKRVIYDAHEDLPQDILSKPYIPVALRRPISSGARLLERTVCRDFDHVVAATPTIRDKFAALGVPATDIKNYPILGELDDGASWTTKDKIVCYVGGLSAARGIHDTIAAMTHCRSDVRLALAGDFVGAGTKEAAQSSPGWAKTDHLGFLSRAPIRDLLSRSIAGLVTLHPTPAYLTSLPIKMFEYMSAGVPVIASDFPLWRELVEENACGICANPLDPTAIAGAIDRLVNDPAEARRMGDNGRQAVLSRYNWEIEQARLVALYSDMRPPS